MRKSQVVYFNINLSDLFRPERTKGKFALYLVILFMSYEFCYADSSEELYKSIYERDVHAVRILLDSGTDINSALSLSRPPPLHVAVEVSSLEIIEVLISEGVDVNAVDDNISKTTALHLAAREGNNKIVLQLLESGAFVDAVNINGITPLLFAISSDADVNVVKSLIDNGADVNRNLTDGLNSIEYSIVYGREQYVQQLEVAGAKFDTVKIVKRKCDGCHSAYAPGIADPQSSNAHLASQHANYITKQLNDYRYKRRVESRSRMSSSSLIGLTDNVIEEVAKYYENIVMSVPNQKPATDLFVRGQSVYMTRIFANGLPSCAGCHGLNGEGNSDAEIPRITGSYPRYTTSQLQHFKSGKRSNDAHGVMRAVSANLTQQEIDDLAYFIGQMR